jgi:hypothetical protein
VETIVETIDMQTSLGAVAASYSITSIIAAAYMYIIETECTVDDLPIPLLVMISSGLPCRAVVQRSDEGGSNRIAGLSTPSITMIHLFNSSKATSPNSFRELN